MWRMRNDPAQDFFGGPWAGALYDAAAERRAGRGMPRYRLRRVISLLVTPVTSDKSLRRTLDPRDFAMDVIRIDGTLCW